MFRGVGLVCLMLLATSMAFGTTITVTLSSDQTLYHNYSYTDTGGVQRNVLVGPYPATLSGGSYGAGTPVYVFCHDYNIDTFMGQPYNGFLMSPSSTIDLEVAYIEDQVFQAGGYNADVQTIAGPASMAVWELENPSSFNPAPIPTDPNAQPFITAAQNAVSSGAWTLQDAAKYAIWFPDDPSASQRFGLIAGPAPLPPDLTTPEASSAMMFCAGALLMFLGRLRRRS